MLKIKDKKEILENKEILSDILDNTKELIAYYEPETDMRILWANKAAADSVELRPHQLEGRYCYEVWHKRDKPCLGCPVKKSMSTKRAEKSEIRSSDGRFWLVRSRPILDENKQIKGIIEYTGEITEYSKINKALKESEEKYRLISENTSDLIAITKFNLKTSIFYVNSAYTKFLGYKTDELIGASGMDLIHPEDKKRLLPMLKKYLKEKMLSILGGKEKAIFKKIEYRIKDKKGGWHNLESTVNLAGNKLLFISKDITEKKEMEKALKKSEERFRIIFNTTQDAIFLKDVNLCYVQANHRAEKYLGLPAAKIFNKTDKELFAPVQAKAVQAIDRRVLAGEIVKGEITKIIKNKKINYHIIKIPLRNNQGKVIGVCGFAHDITELKQIEKKLRQEKDKMQKYLNIAGVIFVAIEADEKVSLINKKGCEILGYKKEEIIGKNWFNNFLVKKDLIKVKKVFSQLMAGEVGVVENYENLVLTKTGKERLISWHNTIIKNDNGKIIGTLGSGEDITERKKTEEKFISTSREWSETFDSMSDGLSIHSLDFIILRVNRSLCELLNLSPEELVGRKCHEVFHKKGSPPSFCPLVRLKASGKMEKVEYFEFLINKWLSTRVSPVFDSAGKLIKVIHVARDITARKK
ncbi:hypothetical protein DRH27_05440, partial [Candidatus Falkowbacteria bacterium]